MGDKRRQRTPGSPSHVKLTFSVADPLVRSKAEGKPLRNFRPEPVSVALSNRAKLTTLLTRHVISPWQYDGPRNAENTVALLSVPFDFDDGKQTLEQVAERFRDYAGVVYPSTGWTPEHPKVRVLLALETPITNKASFQSVCEWLKREYPDADPQVFKVAQPAFPCCELVERDGQTVPSIAHQQFRMIVLEGRPFSFPPAAFATAKVASVVDPRERTEEDEQFRDVNRAELERMASVGEPKGKREARALVIASHAYRCGLSPAETYTVMQQWNALNDPPVGSHRDDGETEEEFIKRMLARGPLYRFGASNDVVSAASDHMPITDADRDDLLSWGTSTTCERSSDTIQGYDLVQMVDAMPDAVRMRFFGASGQRQRRIEKRAITWAEMSDNPQLTDVPKSLIEPYYIALRSRVTLLWGVDKHGKGTLITMSVKYLIAKTKHRILLVNADEPAGDLAARMKEASIPKSDRVFILNNPLSWQEVACHIALHKPDVVVIDALNTYLGRIGDGPPENGDDDGWSRVMAHFNVLAEGFDTALIVIHHANKDSKNRVPRGNAMIPAGVSMKAHINTDKPNSRTTIWYDGRYSHEPTKLRYVGDYTYEEIGKDTEAECDIPPAPKRDYTPQDRTVLLCLMDGKRRMRSNIAKQTRISNSTLTSIKRRHGIKSKERGNSEEWWLSPTQIREFGRDGLRANANDLIEIKTRKPTVVGRAKRRTARRRK